jgi:ADP-ribosylglycohydrolase
LKAVNLGFDTDTVACVAGSFAGLNYGNIPESWIKGIRNKRLINKIIDKFSYFIEYELTSDEDAKITSNI